MIWRNILNDFERADPCPLIALAADKEPSVARGCQQSGAGGGQVGPRIKVMRDRDGVAENLRVDVVTHIDVDTTHELKKLSRPRHVMGTCLVEVFADEVNQVSNFRASEVREG